LSAEVIKELEAELAAASAALTATRVELAANEMKLSAAKVELAAVSRVVVVE
jgi:hypothetical protein